MCDTSETAARIAALMEGIAQGHVARTALDAHCHLGLMENGADVAAQAAALQLNLFTMGVEPEAFPDERRRFACFEGVEAALGLHPWYVRPDAWQSQVDAFAAHLPSAALVGEIGLDFGRAHADTAEAQRAALARMLDLISQDAGRCLSIHAVRAAAEVLDMLEARETTAHNIVIFHWFSGTSADLQRAVRIGARFSVSARMLATRRGRAYARSLPATRLFLETDAPARPHDECSAAALAAELVKTAQQLDGSSPILFQH